MKFKSTLLLLMIFAFISCGGQNQPGKGNQVPKTEDIYKQISYIFGFQMGRQTTVDSTPVDMNYFNQGFYDGQNLKFDSTKAPINFDSVNSIMAKFQMEMAKRQVKKSQQDSIKAVESNKGLTEASKKYLIENKNKPGVKVTASGLQYKIITEGKGEKPKDENTVSFNFIGKLADGKEFDNSYKRGNPLEIPISRLIPGWKEALTMMPVGSKWEIVIPSEIGYGEQGAGGIIPPNATLIFELELIKILNKSEEEELQKKMMEQMQQQKQMQGGPGGPGGAPRPR